MTIVRDKYDVPHVTSTSHDDGVWAAGWIAAEDRGLLLSQARNNAYVAAIDAPGLDAVGLIASLQNFQPSDETEQVVSQQAKVLAQAGPEGKAVLHDIDIFCQGINDYFHERRLLAAAVHPHRHLRAERAQGPVRRRGRR